MNGQKNMSVDFYRVENDLAPLVEVNYWDRENHEYKGLLLLDTGSNINALFGKMADEIERFEEGDISSEEVLGIGERSQRMERICFSFKMGDYVFNEPFLLTTEQMDDYMVGDMPIIGIVGNVFMQRHGLAIVYATHSVYTSEVLPAEFVIEECAYFYRMHMGLKFYGLPIVGIKGKDGEVVALVDTGSTDNSLTYGALKQNDLPCDIQEGICSIRGIGGRVDASELVPVGMDALEELQRIGRSMKRNAKKEQEKGRSTGGKTSMKTGGKGTQTMVVKLHRIREKLRTKLGIKD